MPMLSTIICIYVQVPEVFKITFLLNENTNYRVFKKVLIVTFGKIIHAFKNIVSKKLMI